MRIFWAGCAALTLAGCAMEVPSFAAKSAPEGAALEALLAEATGQEIATAERGEVESDETAQVAATEKLAEEFEAAGEPAQKPKGLLGFLKSMPEPSALENTGVEVIATAPTEVEIDVTATSGTVEATAVEATSTDAKPAKGLLAFLKPKAASQVAESKSESATNPDADGADLTETNPDEATEIANAAMDEQVADATPVKPVTGFLSFLKPKASSPPTEVVQAALTSGNTPEESPSASEVATENSPAESLAVRPETLGVATEIETPKKKGLAGLFAAKPRGDGAERSGPRRSKSTVQPGEVLPFGTVGIACEAKPARDGKVVDQFPREGRAQWKVYDTNPASTGARTQFITGFKDGCPRQVTAALILFGSASLHETHRYSKARKKVSWSDADTAYESIKSKACGVGRGKNCPEAKLPKMEKSLAFVSVYKTFGGTKDWLELLLNSGKLITEQRR